MDPVEAGLLIDFYGNLLTERSRSFLVQYYCEDMTLSEIAQNEGVSRQAVYDSVHRGTDLLKRYENKLGLVSRFREHRVTIGTAITLLSEGKEDAARLILEQLNDRL